MNNAEIISLSINILVGIYFAWFYPRTAEKKLSGGRLPPAFAFLLKVIPPLGYLIIAASVGYASYRLFLS